MAVDDNVGALGREDGVGLDAVDASVEVVSDEMEEKVSRAVSQQGIRDLIGRTGTARCEASAAHAGRKPPSSKEVVEWWKCDDVLREVKKMLSRTDV